MKSNTKQIRSEIESWAKTKLVKPNHELLNDFNVYYQTEWPMGWFTEFRVGSRDVTVYCDLMAVVTFWEGSTYHGGAGEAHRVPNSDVVRQAGRRSNLQMKFMPWSPMTRLAKRLEKLGYIRDDELKYIKIEKTKDQILGDLMSKK